MEFWDLLLPVAMVPQCMAELRSTTGRLYSYRMLFPCIMASCCVFGAFVQLEVWCNACLSAANHGLLAVEQWTCRLSAGFLRRDNHR